MLHGVPGPNLEETDQNRAPAARAFGAGGKEGVVCQLPKGSFVNGFNWGRGAFSSSNCWSRELGLESMRRVVTVIFGDNFLMRVFVEGSGSRGLSLFDSFAERMIFQTG